jgi:hypothetical protein
MTSIVDIVSFGQNEITIMTDIIALCSNTAKIMQLESTCIKVAFLLAYHKEGAIKKHV